MWTAILILPGLIALYFIFLQSRLRALPALKTFYARADGFWETIWSFCGNSLTIAWSYFVGGIGLVLNQLDNIAATLGDPNFKQQVTDLLHADPKYLGYFAMVVSGFTIASRLRSIGGKP